MATYFPKQMPINGLKTDKKQWDYVLTYKNAALLLDMMHTCVK